MLVITKQLPRPCTSDFESLFNETRNFGGKYRKSAVNNFLEKKRINNLDEDSIEYVKGDFEPIISEELWTKCEKIRKGTRAPKLLWVSKLRCRCGGSYHRFKWRTLADGTDVYGYQCVVRTQNPTRSFVLATNMEQTNFCDAISIPQWKLELMAKAIFDRVSMEYTKTVSWTMRQLTRNSCWFVPKGQDR